MSTEVARVGFPGANKSQGISKAYRYPGGLVGQGWRLNGTEQIRAGWNGAIIGCHCGWGNFAYFGLHAKLFCADGGSRYCGMEWRAGLCEVK